MKKKLIRVTTVAMSQKLLLKGQLRFLNEHYEVVALASDDGMLGDVAEQEGVRTIAVPMRREISVFRDIASLWRLYRTFRRERPHIVHANTPKGSLLSMAAGWMARVPHRVYTVTGLRYETASGMMRRLLVGMERMACRFATKVIPEGEGVRSALEEARITSKPLRVIHNGNINGVDLDHYNVEAVDPAAVEALRRPDTFTYVFVGRMVNDKGITELVDAFVRVNDQYPDTRLLLVGPFEPQLDPIDPGAAHVINTHPCIEAVGFQDDIRPYLAASDVMVHPSYREGFPNVVLQGGAMGLPVIVTDINGSNEIIRERVNGTLVPVKDAEVLAGAMSRFYNMDKDRLQGMRRQSREVIERRYNCHDVHRALLQMYDRL